jgi:hypothetical protein
MADLVSEIISQGALDQLELANAQLELAVKNVNNVATAAKGIVIDFKGAGNIGELNAAMAKQAENINTITEATKKYEAAVDKKQRAIEIAERNELLGIQKVIAEREKQRLSDEKIRQAQERYGQAYVEQLKKEELAAEKLRQKQEAFGNAYIAQLEKEADALAKKTAKEQKEIDKLNNAYEQLKVRYNAAAAEAKQLAAAYGLTSVQAQQATKDAQAMAVQLKQIEASVGQHQRNVGDYAQSTFALSQVIREAPAFANSVTTGLSAISNNLPILFDEFGRLRETVGSTTKAIGIMFKSIFSFTNIFILALTAFQLFGKELFQVSKATQAANDALNKYNESLQQIAISTSASIAQHLAESQALLATARNADLAGKTKVDAVEKFRKANEGLFDDYNDEQLMLENIEGVMQRLTKATYARFAAEAFGKKSVLAMQQKFAITTETVDEKGRVQASPIDKAAMDIKKAEKNLERIKALNKAEKANAKAFQDVDETEGIAAAESAVFRAKEVYKKLENQIADSERAVKKFGEQQQKALQELQGLMPQGDTDNLQKLKAELSVRKSIIETMQLAKGITVDTKASEVDKLISQDPKFGKKLKEQMDGIKQLEELIAKLEGKGKKGSAGKKVKDTTAKSESDLLRTEYELNKQRTEQNAAMLKEIADNEKNTLNQRLDAYMEYQSELFQAAVLERDYIVKQEQAKQAEIREKLKTAKGQEIENLNDQLIASNLRIKTAEEKTAGEFIDIEKKQAEGRLAIIESANEKFIDAQKELLTKLTTGELALYSQEIENLKIALDTKEITRRQYNKRLAEVQKKQQIAFLQAEIEFDEKVLANLSLTAEKRKQFEEKLAKDKEAKLKAEKGVATPRKGGSRITDSVAKLFVPEDMENEEQYLQEFYDRTVELANQAANAIIEAKNRQFEAENARLDEQARKIEANYTEQSRLINATVKDETERYNQQQKLLAQTEAQQATIEDRKREVARRQAAAQKTASMAAIIQNTAVAIAAAMKYTVGAGPIIALITASGAVQLAAAANTPIPAYKEGTTYHKGGKFIAGDGGEKELIIAPNKTPYWSNSISTLYDEAEGTKVIPKSAMQYAMANTTSNVGNISAAYDARNSAIIAETIGSIVSREFDKTGRKLATVIVNSQPKQHQTESVADELRKMRNLQGL